MHVKYTIYDLPLLAYLSNQCFFSELNVQPSWYTKDKTMVNSNSYSKTELSHIEYISHFLAKLFFLKGTFINVHLEIFITNCLQCTKCQSLHCSRTLHFTLPILDLTIILHYQASQYLSVFRKKKQKQKTHQTKMNIFVLSDGSILIYSFKL